LDDKHSALNPSQRHRLLITCKHIDTLLSEIEQTLHATASKRIFTSYIDDISDRERHAIEEYVARIRARILEVLAGQALGPEEPHISAAHSIHVGLSFIEIAVAELAPRYMRGYGPISEQAARELVTVVAELQSAVKELHGYMLRPSSA